jgi:uncharacterized protein YjcR
MLDAEAKGRLVFAKHLNKLTDSQKNEIRGVYARGMAPQLAEKYKVSSETIRRVVFGYPSERWNARKRRTI